MAEIHCRHFSGYKPCGISRLCDRNCVGFDEVRQHVLIIHLGALGAVLRSTALLPAIHRTFPKTKLTWVTGAPAQHLLENNPLIDRILTLSVEDQLRLRGVDYDAILCIDKSEVATGLMRTLQSKDNRGFKSDGLTGAILPASALARELWEIGLSNELKFFKNLKTENQLVHEALGLGEYKLEEYGFTFTSIEGERVSQRTEAWAPKNELLIGLNTGCSGIIAHKKLSISFQRRLIQAIGKQLGNRAKVVLLGGPEDEERNREIAEGLSVISSPVNKGLRDGMISVAACNLIISGDSLGLHMGIAQKKWCIAWFGPTCAQEIELYGRGEKILTKADCGPCWKRACDKKPMCYDLVSLDDLMRALMKGISCLKKTELNSSFRRPFPETFSSVSRS
jgi:heptosyltransferase-2